MSAGLPLRGYCVVLLPFSSGRPAFCNPHPLALEEARSRPGPKECLLSLPLPAPALKDWRKRERVCVPLVCGFVPLDLANAGDN